jgi:hypothetical protein
MSVEIEPKYQKIIRQYSKTYDKVIDFQGADVFIITKYENQYCVVLFEDAFTRGNITMPGGRCDSGHTKLSDVASQELFEESLKSIKVEPNVFERMDSQNVKPNLITYIDIEGARGGLRGYRRVYFCYMPSIDVSNYDSNKISLNRPTTEDKYKETVKLILIPINNIISIVIDPFFYIGHKRIKDINNFRYTITRTTMNASYNFLAKYNNFTSISPSPTPPPSASPRTIQPAQRKTQKTSRSYNFGFSFFFPKRNKSAKTTITTTTPPPRTPRTTRTIKDSNLFYIKNMLSKIVVFIGYELIINSDSTQTIKYIMI